MTRTQVVLTPSLMVGLLPRSTAAEELVITGDAVEYILNGESGEHDAHDARAM